MNRKKAADIADIMALVPIDFFMNPRLGHGGMTLADAGAFSLQAIGYTSKQGNIDGQPLRSQNQLFFCNGMFSMVLPSKEWRELRKDYRGYAVKITPQLARRPKNFSGEFIPKTIWQVSAVRMIHRGSSSSLPVLAVYQDRLNDLEEDEKYLFGIDGNPGQHFYLQSSKRSPQDMCWLCPIETSEHC
ncbi:hypothetical protein HGA64_03500 [Candidatus Falkowbacteria bacterium]|nr:hypothetical protein [Candidatus Falkowbacteria bacterium]